MTEIIPFVGVLCQSKNSTHSFIFMFKFDAVRVCKFNFFVMQCLYQLQKILIGIKKYIEFLSRLPYFLFACSQIARIKSEDIENVLRKIFSTDGSLLSLLLFSDKVIYRLIHSY